MATAKKIGYAVVGLGNLARNSILPAFSRCKRSKLIALVSRDAGKAAHLARKFEASASYSTEQYNDCLKHPEISAVYVATPPGHHETFTVRAAQAGKHVLCEKPLAATSAQSQRMVDACPQNGVLLMTAYRKYFEPSTLYIKSLIEKGALGRLDAIHTSFSEIYDPKIAPAWLLDHSQAGGGPMMDLGVYCVNTSRWLAGEDPVEAAAESWRHDTRSFANVEEGVTFRLKFQSGLVALGNSTFSAAISSFLFVQGSKGWLSLCPAFTYEDERHLQGKIAGRVINRCFKPQDEFALELDFFSSAILEKKPIMPDGVQGHRDMIILGAIYESARTHRPVRINYLERENTHGC
jgi:predicted dehydrogenase